MGNDVWSRYIFQFADAGIVILVSLEGYDYILEGKAINTLENLMLFEITGGVYYQQDAKNRNENLVYINLNKITTIRKKDV